MARRRKWRGSSRPPSFAATCARWSGWGSNTIYLPRESEILHLKFWDAAFEQLKQRNAIHLAASGKNAGCWVMRTERYRRMPPTAEGGSEDDDAKIIVRSNGTVTYVGKDIAYQLWKFGLLGTRFSVREIPHLSGRAHAVVQRFERRRSRRARVWKRRDRLQRDRRAAGIFAKRGGGRTARAWI